jgi:hypothetical protein
MNESRILSITKRGLFVKSALLSTAIFGIVLARPVTGTVIDGAHKICQLTMKTMGQCEKLC